MTESCGGREGRRCRGSLTTTALIGTMLLHLMRDRRPWELVRDDPQRVPAAVEEAVRHDTAVQGFRAPPSGPSPSRETNSPQKQRCWSHTAPPTATSAAATGRASST